MIYLHRTEFKKKTLSNCILSNIVHDSVTGKNTANYDRKQDKDKRERQEINSEF